MLLPMPGTQKSRLKTKFETAIILKQKAYSIIMLFRLYARLAKLVAHPICYL